MSSVGDILRRFRVHGVPGAPATLAVPADRTAALRTELEPVFRSLEGAQDEAVAIVADAEHRAGQHCADAAGRARRIVAEARAGVVEARDEAAAAQFAQAAAECARVRAAGEAEAERVARVAAERLDALVESVVAHVFESGDAAPAPWPGPEPSER